MKLKELEKRLTQEPENLGLRVQVAGLMREAGRSVEAVEHYRSVAIAYRDQGRVQQAIAVCRSILEIAPDDAACQGLLASLQAPAEPVRRSSLDPLDETPLPRPIPHHVVDPTSQQYKLSERELQLPLPPAGTPRPSATDSDYAAELETRERVKVRTDQVRKLDDVITDQSARLTPIPQLRDSDSEDLLTEPRETLPPRASDDEMTRPHPRGRLFDDDES